MEETEPGTQKQNSKQWLSSSILLSLNLKSYLGFLFHQWLASDLLRFAWHIPWILAPSELVSFSLQCPFCLCLIKHGSLHVFLRFSADFGSGFLFPHCNLASVFITYSCVVLWSCCLCLQTLFSIFGYQIWKFQQFFNNHGPCFCSLPVVMCCFALIWFEWKLLQVCSRWVFFFACDALLIHLLIVVPFKFSFYNLNSQRCAFLFRVSIHICFIKVFIFWKFNSSLYIVQLNILVYIVYFLTSKYFF